ncbi:hypothetical protein VTO73DRAFT_11719 [Trametes versicolor]
MPPAFENARPASRLVNAYVSVHLSHATFDDAIILYCMLFAQLVLQKDAVPSYVEALERCTRDRGEPERRQALQFTREVWKETLPLELAWRRGLEHPEGVSARMVKCAHTAMIRIFSLVVCIGQVHEGLEAQAGSKLDLGSTRTTLSTPLPLVRLLAPLEVPDDTLPPLLSFQEVEILHHRLVAVADEEGVRYLKWGCMAYAGALKQRKEAVLRAQPEPAPKSRIAQGQEGIPAPFWMFLGAVLLYGEVDPCAKRTRHAATGVGPRNGWLRRPPG